MSAADHDFVGSENGGPDELCGFVEFDHFLAACALNEPVVRCGLAREAHGTEEKVDGYSTNR